MCCNRPVTANNAYFPSQHFLPAINCIDGLQGFEQLLPVLQYCLTEYPVRNNGVGMKHTDAFLPEKHSLMQQ